MKAISLWRYACWLVAIRFLLPISIVVLFAVTGLDLSNIGIPVLSAILAAALAGRGVARSAKRMPEWQELIAFAFLGTCVFIVVNYFAYYLLAQTGIGPIENPEFLYWHQTGQIGQLMRFLTIVAFVSNAVLFPICIKAELRAMARPKHKEPAE